MKKQHIPIPCSENWESMKNCGEDKFCSICNKTIYDFDSKTVEEIDEILLNNPKVCAKISVAKNLSHSFLIAVSLSVASCSAKISNAIQTENTQEQLVTITGKVLDGYSKYGLQEVKIDFFTLSKIYRTYSDEDGGFILKIPAKHIRKINLIEFTPKKLFTKSNNVLSIGDANLRSSKYLFTNQDIKSPLTLKYINYAIIGGVLVSNHIPNHKYFIDGQKVKESKFKKIQDEKDGVLQILEVKDEKKAIYGKDYIDDIYLFYTKDAIEIQNLE